MNKVIEKHLNKLAHDYAGMDKDFDTLYRASIRTMKSLRRGGYIKDFSVEKEDNDVVRINVPGIVEQTMTVFPRSRLIR